MVNSLYLDYTGKQEIAQAYVGWLAAAASWRLKNIPLHICSLIYFISYTSHLFSPFQLSLFMTSDSE